MNVMSCPVCVTLLVVNGAPVLVGKYHGSSKTEKMARNRTILQNKGESLKRKACYLFPGLDVNHCAIARDK